MLKLGQIGETLAKKYLQIKGFFVLSTGYRCDIGEIDIIAQKQNVLYFVEVKTRSSLKYGRPAEAVNKPKQHKIRQVARYYLQKYPFVGEIKFAVIEVLYQGDNRKYLVNWISDAFLGVD